METTETKYIGNCHLDDILKIQISQAFAALREARKGLYEASEAELEAKEDLKSSESLLLRGDKITGKNAEAREAQVRAKTFDERKILEEARKERSLAQFAFDIASMEVDEIKWLIRAEGIKEI